MSLTIQFLCNVKNTSMCNCACLKGKVPTRFKSITIHTSFKKKKSLFSVFCRTERHNASHKIRRICDLFNNEEDKFVAI